MKQDFWATSLWSMEAWQMLQLGSLSSTEVVGAIRLLIGGRIQISDWKDRMDRIAIQERAGFDGCPGACTFDRAQMQLCFMQKSC
jgi:hypothetical protein